MSPKPNTKTIQSSQDDTTHSEPSENISSMNNRRDLVGTLRESDVIVPSTFGCLMGLIYSAGLLMPTVWSGSLLYLPALFAGMTTSLVYNGGTKEWIIGGLSGSISSLPLLVALAQLHLSVGVTSGLFGSVLLSMISATVLGMIGSYIYSYFD